jgi:hypothetical protein
MIKIKRYQEYVIYDSMSLDLIRSIESSLNENIDSNRFKSIQDKIIKDLKLNFNLVGVFGAGIGAFYPIVQKLMTNTPNITVDSESVVLATICAFTIIYLEEKKTKDIQKLTKDSKSMLEELRMRGIGDFTIKKVIKALQSIKNIFDIIGKHIGAVIAGFVDMFSYTSILIPVMNGILSVIGKYDLNLDTIIQNFIGLGVGIGTVIAKHGIIDILDRLKLYVNKKKVIDEIETPVIQKFGDKTYGNDSQEDSSTEMIKEQ